MSLSLLSPTIPTPANQTPVEPVVVSAVCRERRGVFTRSVRRLLMTPENVKKFWDNSRKYPILFNEEVGDDFKKFTELFLVQVGNEVTLNGLFWVVDDFLGVYYMNHIVPGFDAQVHYAFFDGVQSGREDLTRTMLQYVFHKYKFHRLSVQVPCFASKSTHNFVARLGFKYEGKKKEASFKDNTWFDITLYGMLPEYLNGNAN